MLGVCLVCDLLLAIVPVYPPFYRYEYPISNLMKGTRTRGNDITTMNGTAHFCQRLYNVQPYSMLGSLDPI